MVSYVLAAMRLFVLLALVCVSSAEEQKRPEARLLSLKKVLNRYLVENRDVSVDYELFNVGDAPALNVKLTDRTFPPSDFDIVSGSLDATFDKILPGANVTHSLVVKPNKYGLFNFTSAEVTYRFSEDIVEVCEFPLTIWYLNYYSLNLPWLAEYASETQLSN